MFFHFFLMISGVFLVQTVAFGATCPDGYTAYLGPASDLVRNANGECSQLCGGSMTSLNTSNGYRFDLFASRNTTPAINIEMDGVVCYADLIPGAGTGTLNIKNDSGTYHANISTGELCPVTYNLSYSCGDGATGTPPETRDIVWGGLITGGYDIGTCRRMGYYANGWLLDGATKAANTYLLYNYSGDKVLSVRWSPGSYGVSYICNNPREVSAVYSTASYGSRFTPNKTACPPMCGKVLSGYKVLEADGTDTGTVLGIGESFVWNYDGNMRMSAIWDDDEVVIQDYTLSYSCGSGATGTPPSSRTIRYGHLYTPGHSIGTCARSGYIFNGWSIESYSRSGDLYYPYLYSGDRVLVAQWTRPSYAASFFCDNGTVNSQYMSGTYASSYTPSTNICTPPDGRVFAGWRILDASGQDTGDVVAPGKSFQWLYDYNIRFQAIWE